MRDSRTIGRTVALGAVLIAVAAVVFVLLGSGSPGQKLHARFLNASQLVNGNLVQIAGKQVGKVTEIKLTDDGQADVSIRMDGGAPPLRRGTEATVRAASLSGVASRYVDLRMAPGTAAKIPDGGTIPATDTNTAVDLDQIFNVFDPKTRRALRDVFRGSATQYAGRGAQANAGLLYLNPSLISTARLSQELASDRPALRRFITSSSRLVTDLAQRDASLSGLVDHLATTTGAIARRRQDLGQAVDLLPQFMRRADTTFVNLRSALDNLDPLVAESKPVAKSLRPFLAQLQPLARDARPTIRDLSRLVFQAGVQNDLIDLARSAPPLRKIAVGQVVANGKTRDGAFPESVKALTTATPELASFRPYAPDLLSWFDDFSHTGVYDALGGVSRVQLAASLFTIANGLPTSTIIPPQLRAQAFGAAAAVGQYNRCPGASERDPGDGSAIPYRPDGLNCDPKQAIPGK